MSKPLLRNFRAARLNDGNLAVGVQVVATNPGCGWCVEEQADSTAEDRHVLLTLDDDVSRPSRYGNATAPLDFTVSRARQARSLRVTVRRTGATNITYAVPIRDE